MRLHCALAAREPGPAAEPPPWPPWWQLSLRRCWCRGRRLSSPNPVEPGRVLGLAGFGSGGGGDRDRFDWRGSGACIGTGSRFCLALRARAGLGGGCSPRLFSLAFIEGNIDGAFGESIRAAGIICQRSKIRVLAAIGIDGMDRAHALRGEFGDLRCVALLHYCDIGLRFAVALQRRAGGGAIEMRSVGGSRVEHIMLVADAGRPRPAW